jgi:hypothetical protein
MAATIIGPMLLGVPLGLSFYDHLARAIESERREQK